MALKKDSRSWKKSLIPKIFASKDRRKAVEESYISSGVSTFRKSSISGGRLNSDPGNLSFSDLATPMSSSSEIRTFKIFVATWNVGGKPPHNELNLDEFLCVDDHKSDIYVLGFQEIVPLNAGNVLVLEDSEPAAKWLLLIEQSLNSGIPSGFAASFFSSQASKDSKVFGGSLSFQKPSLRTVSKSFRAEVGSKLKTCNCHYDVERKYIKDSCFRCQQAYAIDEDSSSDEDGGEATFVAKNFASASDNNRRGYRLVASKQMVGIFVTIWAKKEHALNIGHLRLSCVNRGIMGYLGNKGCISVSMSLHRTSFCFVCSHLASGEKEGDELRRNSDVVEILKNTQFPRICQSVGRRFPEKILDHERVIWLGDLNYRIALSYLETRKLLEENDWDALFEKDQLKIEMEAGRVFKGWNEGKIFFRPTYKYSRNSDSYAGESVTSKKKRRTPAWCDRILWYGDGISQLSYIRGESRFSDHRPVCALFMVDVEVADGRSSKKGNVKIEVEELLPPISGFMSLKMGSL